MQIGILGSGAVGQTLAADLSAAGHDVVIGTRDPDGREAPPGVTLGSQERACDAELVINALNGQVCLSVLEGLAQPLRGRVLLDVTNPLDFSQGFPPTLFTSQTDSLGEQIQRALPQTRVVKSLNTLNAALMLNPDRLPGPSALFLSGDDPDAKGLVRELLMAFGWEQIIDLGGIQTARGVEMLMPMWLQMMAALGGPDFNWSVVR